LAAGAHVGSLAHFFHLSPRSVVALISRGVALAKTFAERDANALSFPLVEVVVNIGDDEFDLATFRNVGRLVHDQLAVADMSLQGLRGFHPNASGFRAAHGVQQVPSMPAE
jgi:hypothetical protein